MSVLDPFAPPPSDLISPLPSCIQQQSRMSYQHLHRYVRASFPRPTSRHPPAWVAAPPRGPAIWDPETVRRQERTQVHAWQELMVHHCMRMGFRRKQLVASLGRLMLSLEFHDMIVVCGFRQVMFRCHKAIVYAQSKSIRQENPTIRLSCHPLPFRLALEYFYTCDYHFFYRWDFPAHFQADGQTVPVDYVDRLDCCELSLHLQIHILALRLRTPGLKYLSAAKIIETLGRSAFPTVFPRFVREVYKMVTKENALVKRLLVKYAIQVIHGLKSRNHYDGRFPGYIFREIPEFARDFWHGRVGYPGTLTLGFDTGMHIPESLWEC
ncbi:hypothetical protein BJY01DRAFT_252262 [Aspergillus pseudoustus]|uniref:BTB domain-containing protein n=1 Tax=Aspergillus pseudoustus TaxID=1810923 RepID=A0ABR4J7F4_9EURO